MMESYLCAPEETKGENTINPGHIQKIEWEKAEPFLHNGELTFFCKEEAAKKPSLLPVVSLVLIRNIRDDFLCYRRRNEEGVPEGTFTLGCMSLIKKAHFGKKPRIKNLTQGITLSIQEALENQIGIQDRAPQLYFTGLIHLKRKDAPSCCPASMTAALGLVYQCYLSPHAHINLSQTVCQPSWLSERQIHQNKQHIYPAFLNALKLLLEE